MLTLKKYRGNVQRNLCPSLATAPASTLYSNWPISRGTTSVVPTITAGIKGFSPCLESTFRTVWLSKMVAQALACEPRGFSVAPPAGLKSRAAKKVRPPKASLAELALRMDYSLIGWSAGRRIMKTRCLLTLLGLWTATGWSQTTQDLNSDGKNPENVLTQSMGNSRQSYSPLKQINKSNVKRLVPIWSSSLMNDQGELGAPTIYNGVMYVVNGKWTFALDVETGRQIWRTPVRLEPGVQRSAFHRGAATIYNGKLFRVTIDNHLLALDLKTG